MRRIRRRDTGPEMALRRELHRLGVGYRVDWRLESVGRIDIAFPGKQVAVWVDGCFWHGCPDHGVAPKTNSAFWREKLDRNKARDRQQEEALIRLGWTSIRCWEHEVMTDLEAVVVRVLAVLRPTGPRE